MALASRPMRRTHSRRQLAWAAACGLGAGLACSSSFSARDDGSAGTAGDEAGRAGASAGAAGRAGSGPVGAGGTSAGTAGAGRGGAPPNAAGRGGSEAGAGGSEDAPASGAGGEAPGAGGSGGSGQAGTGGSGTLDPSYRDMIVAAEPVAYWRMGPARGAMVADEVGDNDLVFQGSGHTRGLEGAIPDDPDYALGFDGVASFAVATEPRAFDFADGAEFTLECWARHEPGGADYFQHLISNTEGSPGARNGYILYLLPEAEEGDAARSSFELDRIGAEISVWGPVPETSLWTHFAAVSDGASITLYVGGTQAGSGAIDGVMTARTGPFAVGRASNEPARYFKGALDEIAVYPRALGIAEVVEHATFGRVLQPR